MAGASKSLSKTFVWILLGLLIFALMGFGATSFSGTVRSVGSVGDSEIGTSAYGRALQNEIRAIEAQIGQPLSFQQAQALGLPDRVLSQMVVSAALEHEAGVAGISIGDERLADDLRNIPAFRGSDGSFNREAYRFALQNAGLSEGEFEADLRDESAATILQGAVLAGTDLPDTYIDTLVSYAAETRNITWTEIGPQGIDLGLPAPTDADLRAWYDDNIAAFTLPETKVITYAWLSPEMIVDTVDVEEETLQRAYQERIAEFQRPERRLVERLVFPDASAAQNAAERLGAGAVTFEALVTERGLSLPDIDLGDVTEAALQDAGPDVFAAEIGTVVGPAASDLGPALFRVNGALDGVDIPFEEAQAQLRDAVALDRARRVIQTQGQDFDNELAAGATLEDLARDTDMQLGQIDWTAESTETIAAYEDFRAAATAVTEGDFPEIETLEDGGLFALRLDEIRPPAPQPFEDVQDQVRAGWERAEQTKALVAEAETLRDQLAEGMTFEALELTPRIETGVSRNGFALDLPATVITEAFALDEGGVAVLPADGTAILLRLDAILPADLDGEEAQQLAQTLGDRAAQAVAQDLFRALATDIQQRAGVEIDQQAINAVHTNLQ